MEENFYICKHCGNITKKINDSGVPIVCCGENMQTLVANTTEASNEKHIPVYSLQNNIVNVIVGSIEHPMSTEHYIKWIYLKTNKGSQIKYLNPNEKPQTFFCICNDEQVINVYAYCNLHSLWKA